MLVERCGELVTSIRTWFWQFNNSYFTVKYREHSVRPQNCKDEQLQELFDDDLTQTQQQSAKLLHVSQETITRCLRAIEKIDKLDKMF